MNLAKDQWESALFAADIDPTVGADETEGPYVMSDYSGRGMFGRSCPAIVGAPQHGMEFLIHLALELHSCDCGESNEHLALELARDMQVDRLGDAHVIYFPGLEITE